MSSWVKELVKGFAYISKDLKGEYVEKWIKEEISDYDMDMTLIDEKKLRAVTYKRIAEWI